jgi:hypothetical protein
VVVGLRTSRISFDKPASTTILTPIQYIAEQYNGNIALLREVESFLIGMRPGGEEMFL